jgi:hypothetical protein
VTKLDLVLRQVHQSETELGRQLAALVDRHRSDADAVPVGQLLGGWTARHVRRIAETAEGLELGPADGLADASAGEPARPGPDSGTALLADLRRVHLAAAGASVDWVVLGQAAQAARDEGLLALVQECHPETLRTQRWALARIKESAPQLITVS